MQLTLDITQDEQHACRRATTYIRGIAAGLRSSSEKDAQRCERYAATLDALGETQGSITLSAEQKLDVEQGAFLLEGVRNGLDHAELDTAADIVQRDIERLNDLVLRFNTQAGLNA